MMASVKKVVGQIAGIALVASGWSYSESSRADDTEIYQANYQAGTSGRPKVLIVLDDSGSMNTIVQEGGERPDYDPTATYVSRFDDTRIYWSDDANPPSQYTDQYFSADKNRCAESYDPLDNVGRFTTKAKRWRPANGEWVTETRWQCTRWFWFWCLDWEEVTTTYWDGNEAEWRALSSNDNDPTHVDCQADIANPGNSGNGTAADGFPYQPSAPDAADSAAYVADRDTANVVWDGSAYTFYTAHYMDWLYDDTILTEEKDRMQVAQEVVNNLIESNTAIDFGLAVFNDNTNGANEHGGRIVSRIIPEMTDAQRENLTGASGIVNSLAHQGWTPLCESVYEAYRYLAGETVLWGDNRDTNNDWPARDLLAESGGTYTPPPTDCAYTYIILMTDGYPTYDTAANSYIETLTGKTCGDYLTDHTSGGQRTYEKNCLPTLTEYMANRDLDGDDQNGNQFGITYTIGFGTEQSLLEDAAINGKGEYYTADNSEELTAAFQGAILSILSTDSTFTSPAVAVDTFTRTQSRNEVYFAMFKPDATMDWRGNIKRLNIAIADGTAELVDANGNPAIDDSTGLIRENAQSEWSPTVDGPLVEKGGVGELLAKTDLTSRKTRLWTNTGADDALELFNIENLTADAFGFDIIDPDNQEQLLFALFDVADQTQLEEVILWAIGYDRDDEDEDESIVDNRPWILGDILHSKPAVVNYGARGSFTQENPDARIMVGTNAGWVHMFGNDNGEEDWAFLPKELAGVINRRKRDLVSSERVYGVDSPIVVHAIDLNLDGTIDSTAGDKAYAFITLRRGGQYMYALDISNPDVPEFMWKISGALADFSELGQTWSVPVVAKVPGYADDAGVSKPVLIFGAGYDEGKDDHDTLANTQLDSVGRGVFIVDAITGELVWSVTPQANAAKNLQETGLLHSVPGGVRPVDSNGDELADRMYFADTGGNVWRVDMPGNALPSSAQTEWHITKLFAANGGTRATDRRFFNAPDVVRTSYAGRAVDAVLIGSGDRTNPAEMDDPVDANYPAVDNQFYMIRDQKITPHIDALDRDADCDPDADVQDFRCSLPLTPAELYNVTDNLIQDGTEAEQEQAEEALTAANGWVLDLVADGEKVLAKSLTVGGQIFLPTFSPDSQAENICEPLPGTGRLYVIGLGAGEKVRDLDGVDGLDRFLSLGGLIPETPSPHFSMDGEIRLLLPPGGGALGVSGVGNPMETGATLPQPYGTYWQREDY